MAGTGLGALAPSSSYLPTGSGTQKRRVRSHRYHVEPSLGVRSRRPSRRGLYPRRDAVAVARLPYSSYGLYVFGFCHVEGGR